MTDLELLIRQRQDYHRNLEKAKKELRESFWHNEQYFITKYCEFKVGNVVEIIGDKRKHKRLVIYQIIMKWIFNEPMIELVGWYLDKKNIPVKWEGRGLFVYGLKTDYTLKLSENQENKPVPEKFATED